MTGPAESGARERARAALIEMVLAKAPTASIRGEADGYALHIVHADGSASGHHYAQEVTRVEDIALPELAYIAEHGQPLDAAKARELIRDFELSSSDVRVRGAPAP